MLRVWQVAFGLGIATTITFVVLGIMEGGIFPWVKVGSSLIVTLLIRRQLARLVSEDIVKKVDAALQKQQEQQEKQ